MCVKQINKHKKEVRKQKLWKDPLVFLVPAGVRTVTQEVTPREAASESTRCLTSGAATMAARTLWRLNRDPLEPLPLLGDCVPSEDVHSCAFHYNLALSAGSTGDVAEQRPPRSRQDLRVNSLQMWTTRRSSRSPNVTDWSWHLVLCFSFVSCLQLIYFNISCKKKK